MVDISFTFHLTSTKAYTRQYTRKGRLDAVLSLCELFSLNLWQIRWQGNFRIAETDISFMLIWCFVHNLLSPPPIKWLFPPKWDMHLHNASWDRQILSLLGLIYKKKKSTKKYLRFGSNPAYFSSQIDLEPCRQFISYCTAHMQLLALCYPLWSVVTHLNA